jgi:capsular exopolysaccharide synthesis family protein
MPWYEAQESSDGLKLSGLLHSIRRRWLPATALGILLASLIALLLYLLIPVEYQAIAILRVRRDEDVAFKGRRTPQYTTIQDYMTYKETNATLLTSPYVISTALRNPNVSELPMVRFDRLGRRRRQPVAWLEDELSVDLVGDSEILQISLSGQQPEEVISLLNAVVKSYMEEIVYSERTDKLTKRDTLKKQHAENMKQIKEKMDQIYLLGQKLNSSSTDVDTIRYQHQARWAELQRKESDLAALEKELNEVEVRLTLSHAQRQLGVGVSEHEIEDELEKHPEYFKLKEFIRELDERLLMASERLRPGAPAIMNLEADRALLQDRLERLRLELVPRVKDRLMRESDESPQLVQKNMILQEVTRQALQKKVEVARKDYLDKLKVVEELGGASGQLDANIQEVRALKEATAELQVEVDALNLELQNPPRIYTVQDATIPDKSTLLKKLMYIALAGMLTFACTLAGVAYWDYLGKRVNSTDDVTSTAPIRVVGSLPALQGSRGLLPFRRLDQRTLEAAVNYSIDGIRAALLYNRARGVEVVMITSAGGQEGRTTVASQLAVSMARSGRRTLLIDGDLRSPQQHLVFGLANRLGLSELLRRESTIDEAIQPTAVDSLWLLPAGACDQLTIQGLSSELTRKLFDDLRSRFDFIVVDASPVLTSADALLLGQHADATLISVRRDVSQLPKINAVVDRLQSVGIHVMGAVVNGGETEVRRGEVPIATAADTATQPALTS